MTPSFGILPAGHGGMGTGRPGIFSRLGSAVFGGNPSVQMTEDERRMALRNALMSAGTGMAVAAGGPRSWGQFGPSPIASVLMGLQAGGESYQGAQGLIQQRQRREAIGGLLAVPNRAGLLSAYSRALVENPQIASQLSTVIAAHGGIDETGNPVVLPRGATAFDRMTGKKIAEGMAPAPPAAIMPFTTVPTAGGVLPYDKRTGMAGMPIGALPPRGTGSRGGLNVGGGMAAEQRLYQQIQMEARARLARHDARLRTDYRYRRDVQEGKTPARDENTEINAVIQNRFARGELTSSQKDRLLGGATPARRVITADQRAYLVQRGTWNPALYEVR